MVKKVFWGGGGGPVGGGAGLKGGGGGVAGSIPDCVNGIFHRQNPSADSAFNRNGYRVCFLGGKGGWS